jgi:hypothetical protein
MCYISLHNGKKGKKMSGYKWPMPDHEPGFYWVKVSRGLSISDWTPALFDDGWNAPFECDWTIGEDPEAAKPRGYGFLGEPFVCDVGPPIMLPGTGYPPAQE